MRYDLVHDTRKVCVFVVDPVILMPNPSLCDPVGPMRIVHQESIEQEIDDLEVVVSKKMGCDCAIGRINRQFVESDTVGALMG